MREYRQYIGGEWIGAEKLFDDVDPYRGTVVARVPAGTRADAAETGCAAGFAGFQVRTATRLLRQAANWGYLPVGEVIRSDTPGTFALALRRPLGVVAGSRRGMGRTFWPGAPWSTRWHLATPWC